MDYDQQFLDLLNGASYSQKVPAPKAVNVPRAPLPVKQYPSRTPRPIHKQPLPTLPRWSK